MHIVIQMIEDSKKLADDYNNAKAQAKDTKNIEVATGFFLAVLEVVQKRGVLTADSTEYITNILPPELTETVYSALDKYFPNIQDSK